MKKELSANTNISHYRIERKIGAGGMGEVYLAEDTKLGRQVALKILPFEVSQNAERIRRFVQEAKAASSLNHPNILTIYEIGESENTHYIVSEYIEGKTLREILTEKTLKLPEILDISVQTASALTAAHAARIVHRDVKPENIMVRSDGFVKILDFGLAKLGEQKNKSLIELEDETLQQSLTAKGVILGTVNYMSPEQARGETVDERTDIFSFGVLLYEMIAGKTPFYGDSVSESLANLISEEPQPLARFAANVPDELQLIVSKMLRKNRELRYQTMKGALADLKVLRENLTFSEKLERSAAQPGEKSTEILHATTASANKQTVETRNSFGQEIRRHKLLAACAMAVILISAIGFGYYFLYTGKTPSGGKKTLAVLPFVNASQDPNAEYLSDGMTESIINNLSQISALKVMSKNSTFRFKDNQTDTRSIALQLGAENIVTGDIRQIGNRLVINVRLINAGDDSQIWGTQYVKTPSDIIVTQNEIARDVSQNLGARLSGSEKLKLAKKFTENPQAYELYLKGEYTLGKSKPDDVKRAIEYYQQAIELDPNFALAYLGLASANSYLRNFLDIPQEDFRQKARAYTLKAASLDEELPEVHQGLGAMALDEFRFADAEREYRRAIELNPSYADGHLTYSFLLAILGRQEESFVEAQRGLELDPISIPAISLYGGLLFYARRYDESIAQSKKVLELNPNYFPVHYSLAIAYEMKGDYAASIAERVRINELVGTRQRAEAIQESFDKGGWQGFLRDATSGNSSFTVPPYIVATLCAELGDKDKALSILNKLYEARSTEILVIKVDPRLDKLRDDPRFQELLNKIGFPK